MNHTAIRPRCAARIKTGIIYNPDQLTSIKLDIHSALEGKDRPALQQISCNACYFYSFSFIFIDFCFYLYLKLWE
jgi:hypothetical protein